MVMRGLRRVLSRGCDEVGKGQAVEATLENPERSDLAGALDLGGPVHDTNYTRWQGRVSKVLQCWGRHRGKCRYTALSTCRGPGASCPCWIDRQAVDLPAGTEGVPFADSSAHLVLGALLTNTWFTQQRSLYSRGPTQGR